MSDNITDPQKESNNNKNISLDSDIIKNNNIIRKQKTKYFINKKYQRIMSIIFFIIGCYFLCFLYSFVFSIYVSII